MEQGKRVYINVPAELYAHFNGDGETDRFSFDPSIPLPVELPPGETDFRAETVSAEMILSGILRELSVYSGSSPYPKHFEYYRTLVAALRPDVPAELTEAAVLKARNGDYDTALEIFDILAGLFPSHPAILLNKALVLETKAEASADGTTAGPAGFAAAELAWEDALAAPIGDTLFYAGLFYFKQEEYGRAAELFALYLNEEFGEEDRD